MEIEQFYSEFTDKINACSLQNDLSKQIIAAQKGDLLEKYSKLIQTGKVDDPLYANINSFYLWKDNKIMRYGHDNITVNDLYRQTYYYHNKLYQWLLAVAFEAYEEFLKKTARVLLGSSIPRNAGEILKKLRKNLKEYSSIETVGNQFMISLIENFRHKVVHNNGMIPDQKEFLKKVLESIGIYNNGKYDQKYETVVSYYVNGSFEKQIVLLEVPVLELPGIKAETTVLHNLFAELLNSAYYIKEAIGTVK